MQDSLKYLCSQFGYDWTKNKEMVKGEGGGSNGPPLIYLTSKKPNPCRVNGGVQIISLQERDESIFWCLD